MQETKHQDSRPPPQGLGNWIKQQAGLLGMTAAIAPLDLSMAEQRLQQWLTSRFHGELDYMEKHGSKRCRPAELVPGTRSVISVRMNYHTPADPDPMALLDMPHRAYIARYALGRDYHKVVRRRLQNLVDRITEKTGPFGYRVFADSAPVLEKPAAELAGLGWIGKHTNLIDSRSGSWFFLGEIYTSLTLEPDRPASNHCGTCNRCIEACPTAAIVEPYVLDARLCISYWTIEHKGTIPESLRPLFGNRIFGCDDCQLVCPWNKFSQESGESDFYPRPHWEQDLVTLFCWDRDTFLKNTEGSPIRRIGHDRWLRNIAVALGNGRASPEVEAALRRRLKHPSPLVREHVMWALMRLNAI